MLAFRSWGGERPPANYQGFFFACGNNVGRFAVPIDLANFLSFTVVCRDLRSVELNGSFLGVCLPGMFEPLPYFTRHAFDRIAAARNCKRGD